MEQELLNKEDNIALKEQKRTRKKKVRFSAEFSEEEKEDIKVLNDFIHKCNKKEFGSLISWRDILLYFVKNHGNEKMISSIQDHSFTKEDRVLIKIKELSEKEGKDFSVYDIAAKALKIH